MKHLFDKAMQSLQQDAVLFAKKYPAHAKHLNLENVGDRDPNIERLLEGSAYLAARVEHQIENNLIDLTRTLIDTLDNTLTLATPSKAIAQYCFDEKMATPMPIEVDKENTLISNPVGDEQTCCKFSPQKKEIIYPLLLIDANQLIDGDDTCLSLKLSVLKNTLPFHIDKISFYIDGEINAKLAWFKSLFLDCFKIKIKFKHHQNLINCSHPVFNTANIDLSLSGIDLLKEYFLFRDKLFFFNISGFDDMEFEGGDEFELLFYFKEPISPQLISQAKNLKLGCLPVENNFECYAEPVFISGEKCSYPLVIDATKKESIVSQKVISIESELSKLGYICYAPFDSYQAYKNQTVYYKVERYDGYAGGQYLSLTGNEKVFEPHTISVTAQVTNGAYPRKYLTAKALYLEDKYLAMNATNLSKPTEYLPPFDKQQNHFKLLGLLSINYQKLSDVGYLQSLLSLYDIYHHGQYQIESILDISITKQQSFKKGILCCGIKYELVLDDSKFSTLDEIYFFSTMLYYFLLHYIDVSHYLLLEVRCNHNGKIYQWQSDIPVLLGNTLNLNGF